MSIRERLGIDRGGDDEDRTSAAGSPALPEEEPMDSDGYRITDLRSDEDGQSVDEGHQEPTTVLDHPETKPAEPTDAADVPPAPTEAPNGPDQPSVDADQPGQPDQPDHPADDADQPSQPDQPDEAGDTDQPDEPGQPARPREVDGAIDALLAELIEPGDEAGGPGEPAPPGSAGLQAGSGEPPTLTGELAPIAVTAPPLGGVALRPILWRVAAVLLTAGVIGYGLGFARGGEEIVRREFVYTLDESVPDSFLREDRRLLTQIATLESDAVLTPVAAEFDMSVEDLRDRIDIETVDLSEVLRLDVADRDRATAGAISEAVIAEYLVVSTRPLPSENSEALRDNRDRVLEELATADAGLLALEEARQADARLLTTEESLQRQIDLADEQINRLQGLLDSSLASTLSSGRRTTIEAELAEGQTNLSELEAQLADIRAERAELAGRTLAEPALQRDVDRLETELATIEDELARRALGPLVASPVRVLSEPTFTSHSAHRSGRQGLAVGLLIALPIAAAIALRARTRQLWLA